MYRVDLNSDLGESFGAYTIGRDEDIIAQVSSVNVACGWHGGDPVVMEKTVALCKAAGVAVGAHPGYPDLMGFGRRHMKISPVEAKCYVKYQLGALMAFANGAGIKIQHLKAHGELANDANKNPILARAICEAVAEVAPDVIMLSFVGGPLIPIAKELGLKTANEVFADRAYNDDYTLVARGTPGAMIHDPDEAARRVIRMIKEGYVTSITGKELPVSVHSICVHGDSPQAVETVKTLRQTLLAENIIITNLGSLITE